MPKRLLIVTQHFWPENFRINDMVDGFLADGIVVDILCGLPNYPHGEWFSGYTACGPMLENYHGANLYRCREVPRKGNTSLRIFLNYISFPITASFSLHKLAGGYDAILCYNTSPVLMSFPAILAARKFKAPLTNYVLDIWPENLYSVLNIQNKALRHIASAVSDWHYRRAERLIAMSDGLQARLQARVGHQNAKGCCESQKRYAVIPQYCEDFYDCEAVGQASENPNNNSTATSGTEPTSANMPPDVAPFTLLFAGNFSPAQSLNTVLDALALAQRECAANTPQTGTNTAATDDDYNSAPAKPPKGEAVCSTTPHIRLVLVGDGMSRADLQAQAAQLNLGDWVQFYGSVPATAIPALATTADALVIPLSGSADLGLTIPAKLASCMAAGKPLLVAMNGEGAQMAQQSGGALVSEAANAPALAQNMLALASMPATQRAQMGKAAHSYYKTHFDRSTLLRTIENFIF